MPSHPSVLPLTDYNSQVPNPTNPSLSPQVTTTMYSTISAAVQPSATSVNPQTSHRNSRGTMAAIGVGVTLGVIALLSLGVWSILLFRRRRMMRKPAQEIPGEMTFLPEWRRELPGLDVRFEMGTSSHAGGVGFARVGSVAQDPNGHQAPQELPSPETPRGR
jgi:hypothetical protein